MRQTARQEKLGSSGFTLVEMSIVLVVIGLIVGGILVGQELIKAAEIRATVSQVEKYNAAVNTFRSKYNGLPGDLHYLTASGFGFYTFANPGTAGTPGFGDGNGIVESPLVTGSLTKGYGENIVFWRHLSDAGLIDGVYGTSGVAAIDPILGGVSGNINASDVVLVLPQAKVGIGNYFPVYTVGNLLYYEIHALNSIAMDGYYSTRVDLLIQPSNSYQLDVKMDDGLPNTGVVVARGRADFVFGGLNQPPNNAAGINCVLGPSPLDPSDTYDYAASTKVCALRIKFN